MKIDNEEHYIKMQSLDDRGVFTFAVQKDCSQVRVTADNDDDHLYMDVNINQLRAIRSCIDMAIDGFDSYVQKSPKH